MDAFVRQRGVEAFSVAEALDRRHLDVVRFLRVVSAASATADVGFSGGEECVSVLDTLDVGEPRLGLRVVGLG